MKFDAEFLEDRMREHRDWQQREQDAIEMAIVAEVAAVVMATQPIHDATFGDRPQPRCTPRCRARSQQ